MNPFARLWAVFAITVKRLAVQRSLALAALLGLFIAVTLTMSIPIYADGTYQRILSTELQKGAAAGHPPYAFLFRYIGAWNGALPSEKLAPIDQYLSGPAVDTLGIPRLASVRFLQTDTLQLFYPREGSNSPSANPLEWVTLGTLSGFQEHIQVLEGVFPGASPAEEQAPVDILMSYDLAESIGLQVGDRLVVYSQVKTGTGTLTTQMPVRIAGTWRATDPRDPYWFYQVSSLRAVLFVPEQTFQARIVPAQRNTIYNALWYWLMDGGRIHSAEVPALLGRIAQARAQAVNLLPGMRLDISPEELLINFQKSANALTVFLYAFSAPILGMLLIFIGLVGGMVVGQRRNEIAVLRSRGATFLQIMGMAVLECLILGLVALAAGAPGAAAVATFFGRVVSFLDFSGSAQINADLTLPALQFGLLAVAVALVFMVLPTIGAARHTVISYKQERARTLRPPWWQRAWLDVLLLIPAAYGLYLMKQQGGLVMPGQDAALAMDPFKNPLLLLVPTLGIFALTLLLLRLLPLAMALVAWLASKTNSVGLLMAARYLARTAGGYNAPLILLVMTLSLSTFTASLAQTLDRHVHDQVYYKVGADMSLVELGEAAANALQEENGASQPQGAAPAANSGPQWFFLPVSEHLKVPGVTGAARVKSADLTVSINGKNTSAQFMGIDRVDFSRVAYWRSDFAPEPLGALMNNLARTTGGVLVSRDLLGRGVRLGDTLRAIVVVDRQIVNVDFQIVGVFDYFPSWYPGEKPLVVGNLDFYFEQVGGESPYEVWLRLSPGADPSAVSQGVRELYRRVLSQAVASQELLAAQSRPERQGFFGLLSVGFTALALLTVLGFLLYAFFSFRQRFIELGMLRAIGLSTGQMIVFLASELACLFAAGLGAGTGLGVWISSLFIPHLQVGNGLAARVPPFLVQIDWPAVFRVYFLFGLLFLAALVILIGLLLRMKIFQAVKLGEVA